MNGKHERLHVNAPFSLGPDSSSPGGFQDFKVNCDGVMSSSRLYFVHWVLTHVTLRGSRMVFPLGQKRLEMVPERGQMDYILENVREAPTIWCQGVPI